MIRIDYFEKLKTSTLLLILRQENKEPQVVAVDGLSDESARISRVSEYSRDIERVRKEMDLSLALVSEIPSDEFLAKIKSTPEDYIIYHFGNFLNLVHQLKDKVAHLCDGVTTKGKYKEAKVSRTKSIIKVISEKDNIKSVPRLSEEIKKWSPSPEDDNPIRKVLDKRTLHQHFRSKLSLDASFMDVKLYRTFMCNDQQNKFPLSDYGKKYFTERGETGLKTFSEKIKQEIKDTIDYADKIIQEISKILLENCDLPDVDKEGASIVVEHEKMQDSLTIKNVAKRENVSQEFEPFVKMMEISVPQVLGEELSCFYLVGSVPRGEAKFGRSDINFVVIVKDPSLADHMKETSDRQTAIVARLGLSMDIKILAEEEFLSANGKKLRFICKTDGIVLAGKDLVGSEKFPKPGVKLAILLNSDVREKIDKYNDLLLKNPSPDQETVNKIAVDVSKVALRVIFSGLMCEQAKYERSLPKIKELLDKRNPDKTKIQDMLYDVATKEVWINVDSLNNILEPGFGPDGTITSILNQIETENERLDKREKYH